LTAAQHRHKFDKARAIAAGGCFRSPVIVPAMRRILRCAFAGLLSLALAASGATLGIASHMAHGNGAGHSPHTDGREALSHAEHGHHAHHHGAPIASDEAPQPSGDHPSKTCCSTCTVASPLPPVADASIQLIVSRTVYSSFTRFDVDLSIPVDPGIPKRIG
jgi:hypothetical protein